MSVERVESETRLAIERSTIAFLAAGHPHSNAYCGHWRRKSAGGGMPGMRECDSGTPDCRPELTRTPCSWKVHANFPKLYNDGNLPTRLALSHVQLRAIGRSSTPATDSAENPGTCGPCSSQSRGHTAHQGGMQGMQGSRCTVGRVHVMLAGSQRFGFEMNNSPFQRHRFSIWTRNSPPCPSA